VGVGNQTILYDEGSIDLNNGRDRSSTSKYYSNGDRKSALKDV